jgi:hypothetical protein
MKPFFMRESSHETGLLPGSADIFGDGPRESAPSEAAKEIGRVPRSQHAGEHVELAKYDTVQPIVADRKRRRQLSDDFADVIEVKCFAVNKLLGDFFVRYGFVHNNCG